MPEEKDMITREEANQMIKKAIAEALNKKEPMDEKKIIDALKKLPPQTEREFEKTVVKYAMKWADDVFYVKHTDENGKESYTDGIIFNIINLIKEKNSTQEERRLAFHAFCVAENYARRSENRTDLIELEKQYSAFFQDQPFLLHLKLCREIKELEAFKKLDWDADRLLQMIKDAKENTQNLKGDTLIVEEGNVGSAHILAETILLAFENAPHLLDEAKLDKEKLLTLALETIEKVHRKDPAYGKFYCTHGRLLAVDKRYDEALDYLNIAIDMEDNEKSDYAIRVGRYISYSQQVRAQQQAEHNRIIADAQLQTIKDIQDEQSRSAREKEAELKNLSVKIEQQADEMEQQSKESTTKSMEFLGLFSGIVSFTIGTISISTEIDQFSAKHIAGLIVVLMGALMAVFAGFGIILHGMDMHKASGRKGLRNLFVLLLGIGIVVGGYFLCLG